MLTLLPLLLPFVQAAAEPAPTHALEIRIIERESGEPVPGAEIYWLDAIAHEAKKDDPAVQWPWNKLDAVERANRRHVADEDGRLQLEVPLGGVFVIAKTPTQFTFKVVASGASEAVLVLTQETTLSVHVVDPDGVALDGVRAWLVEGRPDGPNMHGARHIQSSSTDEEGLARFEHAPFRVFGAEPVTREIFESRDLYLVLDVLGDGALAFPVTYDDWRSGQMTCTTPPVGSIELVPDDRQRIGEFSAPIFILSERLPPGAPPRRSRSALIPRGDRYRAVVRLGREWNVSVIGGACVTAIERSFKGPVMSWECVRIMRFAPKDHIPVTLVMAPLPVKDAGRSSFFNIRPLRQIGTVMGGRARVMWSDLGADGSCTVLVPKSWQTDVEAGLVVSHWRGGRALASGSVQGTFLSGARHRVMWREPDSSVLAFATRPEPTDTETVLLAGTVVDSNGLVVPLATIRIHEDAPRMTEESWTAIADVAGRGIQCDREGRFVLRSRSDALRFRLDPRAPGLGVWDAIVVERGDMNICLVVVEAGESRSFPNRPTRQAARQRARPGSISLVVKSPDGSPLSRRPIVARWTRSNGPSEHDVSAFDAWGRLNLKTDLFGRCSISPPYDRTGEWMLEVYTPDGTHPLLYAKTVGLRIGADPVAISLDHMSPSVVGHLVDQTGAPIAGAVLTLHSPRDGRRRGRQLPGPITTIETGEDGEFTFYSVPGETLIEIVIGRDQRLRISDDRTFAHGARDLVLTARRLGAVRFDFALPVGTLLSAFSMELVSDGEEPRPVTHWGLRGASTCAIEGVDPGEYRLRISLPRKTLGSEGPLSDGERVLFETESFVVAASPRGEFQDVQAVDLREHLRVLTVRALLDGNVVPLTRKMVALRSTDGSAIPFWRAMPLYSSEPAHRNECRILIDSRCSIEVAAASSRVVLGESIALRSEPVVVTRDTDDILLEMTVVEPRTLQIDPELVASVVPYELHAVWQTARRAPSSPWHFLWEERRQYVPLQHAIVPASGEITLAPQAALPGAYESDKLGLAVGYHPEGLASRLESAVRGAFTGGFSNAGIGVSFPVDFNVLGAPKPDIVWFEFLATKLPPQPVPGRDAVFLPARFENWTFDLDPTGTGNIPVPVPSALLDAAWMRTYER